MISMYVDNLLIIKKNQKQINQLKKVFINRFKIIDLGSAIYDLGLYIMRNLEADTISFTQKPIFRKS